MNIEPISDHRVCLVYRRMNQRAAPRPAVGELKRLVLRRDTRIGTCRDFMCYDFDFSCRLVRRDTFHPHSGQIPETLPVRSYSQRGHLTWLGPWMFRSTNTVPHLRHFRRSAGYGFREMGPNPMRERSRSNPRHKALRSSRFRLGRSRVKHNDEEDRHPGHLTWRERMCEAFE